MSRSTCVQAHRRLGGSGAGASAGAHLIEDGSLQIMHIQGSVLEESSPTCLGSTPANSYVELLFATESASTFSAGSKIERASDGDVYTNNRYSEPVSVTLCSSDPSTHPRVCTLVCDQDADV